MKKTINLVVCLIVVVSMLSCKNKEKSSKSTSHNSSNIENSEVSQGKIKGYRFIVSFISIGSGTDAKAISSLEKLVQEYPGKPEFEVVSWGREGEKDYCFSLNTMNSSEQVKFIEKVKKEFSGNTLVQFRENGPAKGVRE